MAEKRKNDDDARRSWLRSGSRTFEVNGLWYFQTREGATEGPFTDRYAAQSMLDEYVKVMQSGFASSLKLELLDDDKPAGPRSADPLDAGLGRRTRF